MNKIKVVGILIFWSSCLWAQNLLEIQQLLPAGPTPNNSFGARVAISGDYAIVGSVFDDDNGFRSGSASIYQKSADVNEPWDFVKKITPNDANMEDQFGYCAIDGDIAIVGSVYDDDNGDQSGSVYIFEKDNGGVNHWGQVKKILASDGTENQNFGGELAISGDVVAVAVRNPAGRNGAVYVYHKNQGGVNNWGEVIKIVPPDGGNVDFGSGVSLDGDLLVVGDQYHNTEGSVHVFGRNIGGVNNWGLIKNIFAHDGANEDRFGEDVAIDGDLIVVGAWQDDDNGFGSGSAYIYGRNVGGTNNWGVVRKLIPGDGIPNQYYGRNVEVFGDRIVVTADGDDDNGQFSGSIYVYQKDQGGTNNWGEAQKLVASDGVDFSIFGLHSDLSDDYILVGSSVNKTYVFGNCDLPDHQLLVDLYQSTNGDQWFNSSGWLEECDYCTWYGVTCDVNQNVIGLNLQQNNLDGQLPASICGLMSLQDLLLGENSLQGTIPACIGGMNSLVRLTLSANQFSGPIPDFYDTPNLISLLLAGNDLTGMLPATLGDLPLQALSVAQNQLDGCFDMNLMNICKPTIWAININPGNNFDASWTDFCSTGAGTCVVSTKDRSILDLSISPNPSNGVYTIDVSDLDYSDVFIYDVSGRVVGNLIRNASELKVDLSSQEDGVYVLKVVLSDHSIYTSRLMLIK